MSAPQVQIDLNNPQQILNLMLGRQDFVEKTVATIRTRPENSEPYTCDELSQMLLEIMQTQSMILIALASMQQHRLAVSRGGIAIPQFGMPRNGGR